MSKDILLYENGDGGEILVLNNDVSLVESLYQQVYLALFGGNIEANTTGSETETQERQDWWGNSLFFPDESSKQFNSNTERVLDNVVLNTSGRIEIQRAVEDDLKYLSSVATITVNVYIISENRVEIRVFLQRPNALEDKLFQFIWDNAEKEIIIKNKA